MKKSIILATAAGVGLSLGIIVAQAGPGGHPATGNPVPFHAPGIEMQNALPPAPPHGASTFTPGDSLHDALTRPDRGASTFAPGNFAPGRTK